MSFWKSLYPNFINEVFNFDLEYDYNYTCNVILTKNMTFIEIDRGWEGIPESLVINLILCVLLIMPFLVVKNIALSKSPVIDKSRTNWLQFIYGERDISKFTIDNKKLHLIVSYFESLHNRLKNLLPFHISKCKANSQPKDKSYGTSSHFERNYISPTPSTSHDNECLVNISRNIDDNSGVLEQPLCHRASSSNLVEIETTFDNNSINYSTIVNNPKGYVHYIHACFSNLFGISDHDILKNKGHDAYQYLLFQRYIIIFLFILSFFSIVVILPVNIQGSNEGKAFARTTLSNLPNDSNLYWIHSISSAVTVVLGVYLMSRFASELKTDDDLMYCKTLFIRRMPISDDMSDRLMQYFQINFPRIKLTGIQLIYGYRNLELLEQNYQNVVNAKKYCDEVNQKEVDKRITLRPHNCSRLGCCCLCLCGHKFDAVEYYSLEKIKIENKIDEELQRISSYPSGGAFITFETEQMAMQVYKSVKESQRNFFDRYKRYFCFADDTFELNNCLVCYAPYPDDINWRDIAIDMKLLWLRKVVISILLFVIFFFLSTPAFLLKAFEIIANKELINKGIGRLSSNLSDFLSPFLLMLLATILPSIVTYASNMIPYKTISDLNHAVMSKVFAFLLMMIIILPSAGFLSINAMLENLLLPNSDQKKFRWHCLFPVDNGAFFVIYTLQAALLGNTVEVLRIPELTLYVFYNLILKSPAEYEKARKWVIFDFPFGVSYPRFLLIFTMTITYSHACPLIAPCGLLYMMFKHIVDRYNIYHVYTPTKINGRIHSSAILYVHIALIMMQFQLFTFLLTKTQYSNVTLFSLVVLIISLLAFAFYCFYHWFRNINHLTNSLRFNNRTLERKLDFCVCSYTPPVFFQLLEDGLFTKNENISNVTLDIQTRNNDV